MIHVIHETLVTYATLATGVMPHVVIRGVTIVVAAMVVIIVADPRLSMAGVDATNALNRAANLEPMPVLNQAVTIEIAAMVATTSVDAIPSVVAEAVTAVTVVTEVTVVVAAMPMSAMAAGEVVHETPQHPAAILAAAVGAAATVVVAAMRMKRAKHVKRATHVTRAMTAPRVQDPLRLR